MRYKSFPSPVALAPGDSMVVEANLSVRNNTAEQHTVVGFRWEPVYATDTYVELDEQTVLLEAR